jgi:HD-GYP domain-containing protein (c-di-GMP phosphodiesterase class II)
MTSTRPYRRALPTLHALAEIDRCAGTQFDPDLAHAFLRAWGDGAFADAAAM